MQTYSYKVYILMDDASENNTLLVLCSLVFESLIQ